ncbi:MAG: PadR family transcriptional regulator [Verrucomicrobium sp.]|nr:PadR family transcriptional regulator [Verrucomicrobium sp.]
MPPFVTRPKRSNPLALAVMVLLFERPMHPYEMAATLKERHKEDSIKVRYGSLYTVIDILVRDGMISARETVREGRRPERTIYELTEAGQREFREWMRQLLKTPVKEYPQFEAALSLLGALPPDEVTRLLQHRAEALMHEAEKTRATLTVAAGHHLPALFTVETTYHLKMIEAEVEFVEELIAQIARDGCGWDQHWQQFHHDRLPPQKDTASMNA